MPYLGTSRGRLINPLNDSLTKSDPLVLAEECFSSISKKNRYNGHTSTPYTVGQHTLILLRIAKLFEHYVPDYENLKQTILYHDMHEAFIGDMPRPLKAVLPEYAAFEDQIALKVQACLWMDLDAPSEYSLKFLNILDTEICATWEMPRYNVGFYYGTVTTVDDYVRDVTKMLYNLSYRDLIDPDSMKKATSDIHQLIGDFEVIAQMPWEDVETKLMRHFNNDV